MILFCFSCSLSVSLFGLKIDEAIQDREIQSSKELHELYSSSNTITVIKVNEWVENVA
jgi:hypothetical protein